MQQVLCQRLFPNIWRISGSGWRVQWGECTRVCNAAKQALGGWEVCCCNAEMFSICTEYFLCLARWPLFHRLQPAFGTSATHYPRRLSLPSSQSSNPQWQHMLTNPHIQGLQPRPHPLIWQQPKPTSTTGVPVPGVSLSYPMHLDNIGKHGIANIWNSHLDGKFVNLHLVE